jgi:hypothetical protein
MNPTLEKFRLKSGPFMSPAGANYGAFFIRLTPTSQPLKVICSPLGQGDWDHVSASLPDRCPSWEQMCKIRSLFFGDQRCVVQYHPPEEDYVNNHPFCLHLWAFNKGEIPRPPSILVGIKAAGNIMNHL